MEYSENKPQGGLNHSFFFNYFFLNKRIWKLECKKENLESIINQDKDWSDVNVLVLLTLD